MALLHLLKRSFFWLLVFTAVFIYLCIRKIETEDDGKAQFTPHTPIPEAPNEGRFYEAPKQPQPPPIPKEHSKHSILMNIKNFQYMIKPKPYHSPLIGLLLMYSNASSVALRDTHRQSASSRTLAFLGIRRVFVLGALPDTEKHVTQAQIHTEHQWHRDMLQGNFEDSPRNLIYKHVMGLRWASTEDSNGAGTNFKFIIKADDDTAFDVLYLRHFMKQWWESDPNHIRDGNVLAGNLQISNIEYDDRFVFENYGKGSHVDVLSAKHYLSNSLYVTNPVTARRLAQRAQMERERMLYWMDDVWVTGWLRAALNIPLSYRNEWYSPSDAFMRCCLNDLVKFRLHCEHAVREHADDQLISEFMSAVLSCQVDGEDVCKERMQDQRMTHTCPPIGNM